MTALPEQSLEDQRPQSPHLPLKTAPDPDDTRLNSALLKLWNSGGSIHLDMVSECAKYVVLNSFTISAPPSRARRDRR
jgi:hypothetical protein